MVLWENQGAHTHTIYINLYDHVTFCTSRYLITMLAQRWKPTLCWSTTKNRSMNTVCFNIFISCILVIKSSFCHDAWRWIYTGHFYTLRTTQTNWQELPNFCSSVSPACCSVSKNRFFFAVALVHSLSHHMLKYEGTSPWFCFMPEALALLGSTLWVDPLSYMTNISLHVDPELNKTNMSLWVINR